MICETIIRRVIPPTGGAWIPYTAAEVAARRAAQMVVVMTCVSAAPWSAHAPPLPVDPASLAPPLWPVVELLPQAAASPAHDVVVMSAPCSAAVMAVGLAAMVLMRRR
jgi:hypothetical protein